MVWSITGILNTTTDYLRKKGIPSPRVNAEWLLVCALNYSDRIDLYLKFDKTLVDDEIKRYRDMIQRRIKGEPLQYIIGHTHFFHSILKLTPDVLIPRHETEQLVEMAVNLIRKDKPADFPLDILEIGTGSGAIAIGLAKALPTVRIWACDLSIPAIRLAKENAISNKVDQQIRFWVADWLDALPSYAFDYIISNPPYVTIEEWADLAVEIRDYEPRMALVAPENGLFFYRSLIHNLESYLKKNGWLMLEIGENQAQAIDKIILSAPIPLKATFSQDYNHKDRFLFIQNL